MNFTHSSRIVFICLFFYCCFLDEMEICVSAVFTSLCLFVCLLKNNANGNITINKNMQSVSLIKTYINLKNKK